MSKLVSMDSQISQSHERKRKRSVIAPDAQKDYFKKVSDSDIASESEEEEVHVVVSSARTRPKPPKKRFKETPAFPAAAREEGESSSSCARTRSPSIELPKKRYKETPEYSVAKVRRESSPNNSCTHARSLATESPKKGSKKPLLLSMPSAPLLPMKLPDKSVPEKFSVASPVKKESKIGEPGQRQRRDSIDQSDLEGKSTTSKQRDLSRVVTMGATVARDDKMEKVSFLPSSSAPSGGARVAHSTTNKNKIKDIKGTEAVPKDLPFPKNVSGKPYSTDPRVAEKFSGPVDKRTGKSSRMNEHKLNKTTSSGCAGQDSPPGKNRGVKESLARRMPSSSGTVEAAVGGAVSEGLSKKEEVPRDAHRLQGSVNKTLPTDSSLPKKRSHSIDYEYGTPTKKECLQSPPSLSTSASIAKDKRRDGKELPPKMSSGFRGRSVSLPSTEVQSKPFSGDGSHSKKPHEHPVSFASPSKDGNSNRYAREKHLETLKSGVASSAALKSNYKSISSPRTAKSVVGNPQLRTSIVGREGAVDPRVVLKGSGSQTPASTGGHTTSHKKLLPHTASPASVIHNTKNNQHSSRPSESDHCHM